MKGYIGKSFCVVLVLAVMGGFNYASASKFTDVSWIGNKSSASWDRQVKQKEHLQELLRGYEAHWAQGHAEEVAQLYTEDAIFFAPGAAPFVGHESIEALVQSLMDSGISEVSLIADEIEINGRGKTAYILGHYDLYVGGASVGQGPFLFLMKTSNNEWKIYRDIFNSSTSY